MTDMTMRQKGSGKFILGCFLGFFALICAVDGLFVYTAIHTNTGVVTEQAYEKGLAYNDTLSRAQNQPDIRNESSYSNGVFRWTLSDLENAPINSAKVNVLFFRPVKDGYDFELPLAYKGNGVYEAKVDFPLQGLWTAKLNAKWNSKQYQTQTNFIVK